MQASQWVQRTKSVIIPAEEQSAGCVVDYFYRVEFHSTRRFFSDSNYLCFFFQLTFLHPPVRATVGEVRYSIEIDVGGE